MRKELARLKHRKTLLAAKLAEKDKEEAEDLASRRVVAVEELVEEVTSIRESLVRLIEIIETVVSLKIPY